MRVTLVYPPNRNVPSSPYGALPLLAGCLGEAGHEVRIVDANLEVFDRLVQAETLSKIGAQYDAAWERSRALSSPTPLEVRQLQTLGVLDLVPFERILQATEAARILRDAELFRDPRRVNWAYDTIAVMLRAIYSVNPVYFPPKPGFEDEFFGYLGAPIHNFVQQILEGQVVDQILETKPDLVAVSIPFNEQLVEAFALLKALKTRAPELPTVVGGAIVSAYHEKLCTDPRFYMFADYGMPGEADLAFPAFCTTLEQGGDLRTVPNLYHREANGRIHPPPRMDLPNLNDIATPDFSPVPVGRYLLPYTIANYQTSRGCYYGKCTFCSFDIKENFRLRRPDLVCQDIERIQEQTGLRHFIFWDPLTPPKLMKKVAEWNQDRGDRKIFWGAETKFEERFTQRSFTDLLYRGGGRFLQFGYESGVQRVVDLMVKGNDLSRVHEMLGALRDSNIAVSVQWFIGFPGETEEEAIQSFRYLDEHRDGVLLSSYMGTYTISKDDDVFRSSGELYDIDILQDAEGGLDFVHRDGTRHYDRSRLNTAYLARGDAETVTRMAFYIYLTEQPELAGELANFRRGGALPVTWEELVDARPFLPEDTMVKSYDFDIFTSAEEQGVPEEGGPLPPRSSHAAFVIRSQQLLQLEAVDVELIRRADGSRKASEVVAGLPGDPQDLRRRLLDLVLSGVLAIPLRTPSDVLAAV